MKKWLMIDDDPEDQDIFQLALEQVEPSIDLIKANNGSDGLNQLREMTSLPDLIFLDLNMGKMDGRECIQELKRDSEFKEIPVLIYSTSNDEKDILELTKMGAERFIVKPTNIKELTSILKGIASTFK